MTDKDVAQKKLTYMLDALKDLKEALERHRKENDERFFYYAAQKKAEEIVESAVSINNLILMERFNKVADSYYQSFMDMEPLKIFSKKELEKLAQTSGFRNRLAHEYFNLDPEVTIKSMENILRIYPDYMKRISEFIG